MWQRGGGGIRRRTTHFWPFCHRCKMAATWLYATVLISVCSFCRGQHADVNIWSIPLFTTRCCAFAVLAMGLCPCLCLSVTSQCSTKTAKHRITNNTTRYPKDSSFLMLKISAKFDRGHSLRERQMQVGWLKIGDFWQITGYVSKTVEDRHIVSIKVE